VLRATALGNIPLRFSGSSALDGTPQSFLNSDPFLPCIQGITPPFGVFFGLLLGYFTTKCKIFLPNLTEAFVEKKSTFEFDRTYLGSFLHV
jgi:hypothetical protein